MGTLNTFLVGLIAMHDQRQRVHYLLVDQNVQTEQIARPVAVKGIVE
jgi:hypothetical protein